MTAAMPLVRLGVLGANGRMGTWVADLIRKDFAAVAEVGAQVSAGGSLNDLLGCDVVIDFSTPQAMCELAKLAQVVPGTNPAFVVGSTGWTIDQKRVLEKLSASTPVLMSSNFSAGVWAITEILRHAAPLLEKFGYAPVIVETHHRHKKDAPSGTALSLQRAIAPAGPGNVQTHSIRAGEVIGDHEVTFHGHGDHVTIGHFAQDRSIFARGAIDAALWLARKKGTPQNGILNIDQYFKERAR